jgi:hypothetical protein
MLLASCQPVSFPQAQSPVQTVIAQSPTTTGLPWSLTTETNTPETVEQLPLRRRCLAQLKSLSVEHRPEGKFILTKLHGSGDYFMLDAKNLNLIEFGQTNGALSNLTVSPNHQLIHYVDTANTPGKHIIATLAGEVKQFTDSDKWWGGYWLDNQHLIFGRNSEMRDSTIRIYDPLTGEDERTILNIPNLYYLTTPDGRNILIVSVSADLTRLVFFDTADGGRIIFWDIESNRMLASLPHIVSTDPASPGYPPAIPFFEGWSPNEKQFITTSPLRTSDATGESIAEELFEFDYEGQISRLTNLSDTFSFVRISEPAWAPDGHSIAFWLEVSNDANASIDQISQQLVLLDTMTGEITDLCLQFGEPRFSSTVSSPIWSPDGKYMIVETRMPAGTPRVNLVNIEENSVFALQDGFFPVGWVISP